MVLLCSQSWGVIWHLGSLAITKFSVGSLRRFQELLSTQFFLSNSLLHKFSSLELQLSLFNSPRAWFSDWLLPPVPLCRNGLQADSWTNHSAHVIRCPSLRGHRSLLQDPRSKNSNFIYFFFLVFWLLVMGGLMQHRYHSWPEAGISPLLFHSQFLLLDL